MSVLKRRWVAALAGSTICWSFAVGDEDQAPKYTIKHVMRRAHKEGPYEKVIKGKASDDEKADLLELYEALEKNRPPTGDSKQWKKRTKPIVEAARGVVEDERGSRKRLENAVNCLDCHKAHRKK
jgi:hypothetical protein